VKTSIFRSGGLDHFCDGKLRESGHVPGMRLEDHVVVPRDRLIAFIDVFR